MHIGKQSSFIVGMHVKLACFCKAFVAGKECHIAQRAQDGFKFTGCCALVSIFYFGAFRAGFQPFLTMLPRVTTGRGVRAQLQPFWLGLP